MTASIQFLATLVGLALLLTMFTPLVLLALWLRDWKRGQLW